MLGEAITRGLVLVLGYAYPALECFKAVERRRVEIEELRFWCRYWIIVALLTVFERVGDIFISWLPMYDELKLALFIYLWYPKTKGTGYVYEALLRPFVTNHETDIDRSMQELRIKAWELAIYYWHNCTELGQTKFFQLLDYMTSHPAKASNPISELENQHINGASLPPPKTPYSFLGRRKQHSNNKQPSSPKSDKIQGHLNDQTQFVQPEDLFMPESIERAGSIDSAENRPRKSRFLFRRSK